MVNFKRNGKTHKGLDTAVIMDVNTTDPLVTSDAGAKMNIVSVRSTSTHYQIVSFIVALSESCSSLSSNTFI